MRVLHNSTDHMKTIKVLITLSIFIIFLSCKKSDQTKSKDSFSIEEKSQEKSSENSNMLILTENTLGDLKLEKGMPLDELKIKKLFNNLSVSKNIGEQDGPNYFYYKIGTEAILTTPNTENEILSQLWINEKSKVSDEYGIKLGMIYSDIEKRRTNMNISTEHYHIYLYKEGSNIVYEMSLENYNGPDKEEYSLEDIKNNNSKVVSIIWK